ncbi:alpha/beta fold hydrolase [Planotetraspora mira]|uniref:Alpha/beta hydrolase n=1 Tax=Planotetraspora mira TaxID=58121 RepID=A0A8J3XA24_9ACTN|nr:hypothetical protein [Planotetraspora mira]GII32931.1 hypothetical protein Pmi06nite_63730 [Planotetraspora mira]
MVGDPFAPQTEAVFGTGLGALTALALTVRSRHLVRALILLDTLPGAGDAAAGKGAPRPAHRLDPDLRHEVVENSDRSLSWRHHLGNLPPESADHLDDETLWDQLAVLAAFDVPVVVVRAAERSRLTDDAIAELRRRAPGARLVTTDVHRPRALAQVVNEITKGR